MQSLAERGVGRGHRRAEKHGRLSRRARILVKSFADCHEFLLPIQECLDHVGIEVRSLPFQMILRVDSCAIFGFVDAPRRQGVVNAATAVIGRRAGFPGLESKG